RKTTVAIAFQKPFAGYELNTQSVVFAIPFNKNVFGLSFQRYGYASYNEQRAAFCYAKGFGDQLYVALNFNYHLLTIESYGSASTYSVEAGIQYHLNEKFSAGVHVANPTNRSMESGVNLVIPGRVQVGASYLFSEKVLVAFAAEKTLSGGVDTKAGLEYQIIELLALRGGISANPFKHYAGVGLGFRKLKMDIAASSQPVLGYSPQIALSYEF
ncbi:MAG TPA: hypothetical protein VLZ28_05285, partial [Daejeonella sp.]|nr:hypothetical protein [Daejeonella sp.]